jgi:enoyl-CoA hydratase/carnithine racemase
VAVVEGQGGYETILLERDRHVAILTFNRPEKLNALSPTTMRELGHALDAIQVDAEVRCLVLTGAGDRAFSTGFDLDGLEFPRRTDHAKANIEGNFNILIKLWDLRIPVIAAVNGYAVAAGSNIAMICDITIASERAKFGEPEIRHLALSPMLLLPWFTSNPKMVHYLYYTGDTISAREALDLGLVAKVVPHEQLLDEARRMARRIALVPPYAVEMTKESLRRTYETMGFRNALHSHRYIDSMVLGGGNIPEKDRYFAMMEAGDMKAFLAERDGPFKSGE